MFHAQRHSEELYRKGEGEYGSVGNMLAMHEDQSLDLQNPCKSGCGHLYTYFQKPYIKNLRKCTELLDWRSECQAARDPASNMAEGEDKYLKLSSGIHVSIKVHPLTQTDTHTKRQRQRETHKEK